MCRWLLFAAIPYTVFAQISPQQTQKGFKVAEGLEVTVWAGEPNVRNPTNIDIDDKGRIWYLEAVNYRRKLKGLPDLRKEGDRIVILEDTDGDGKADKKKVFHQDPALRSPLGISVLGNKVIVSQAPDIIVYTKDEDDRIISREVLLTGWNGVDHDHGLHAVTFGHDGRYYFNSGDQGFDVTDKSSNRFVSGKAGPYYAGTALRMNPDGTGFTVLGDDFRNPYELALDSFGNIWQSDNDDDGNAWTRFNYVMAGGRFGYWGPGGRSWREDRGTHFHQENPGIVPNIARLGAGSPCGLVIYEGKLLPEKYRGQPLHAEAGKRQVNTYFLSGDGAGYSLKVENTIAGDDTWFRPSDVAVAPDGAVYVADWYDPGVGGHNMGDTDRGRIYRLAPIGYKSKVFKQDYTSSKGLLEALGSPAQAVRYIAYTRLREQGPAAIEALTSAWKGDDYVLRARALWLIGALGERGWPAVAEALSDRDERFRILGLRVMELYFAKEFRARSMPLWSDPSPRVRAEIAVLAQYHPMEDAEGALEALARQYDGQDRWYLEALGIGMKGRETAFAARLANSFPGPWDSRYGKLLWRLRVPEALPRLSEAANSPGLTSGQRIEAMEAIAALKEEAAMKVVAGIAGEEDAPAALREAALGRLGKRLFSEWTEFRGSGAVAAAVEKGLGTAALRKTALEIADDLEDPRYAPALARMANDESLGEELRAAAVLATGKTRAPEFVADLAAILRKDPMPLRVAAIRALGFARPASLEADFRKLILSKEPNEIRSEALRVLAGSDRGANLILDLEQKQALPAELRTLAANLVAYNRTPAIRARAEKILPPPVAMGKTRLPPARSLVGRQGDAAAGKKVFFLKANGPDCAGCHALEEGKPTTGPNLSAIGTKLGKDALLDSILNPSAAIAHEYVTWILDTKNQGQVIGILAEDTPQRVVVKTENGEAIRVKPADITGRRKSNLSMMPEDLVGKMTERQLVDLLEYLTTLREEKRAGR